MAQTEENLIRLALKLRAESQNADVPAHLVAASRAA